MMFSVIIPTCNRRALLEQALASVWAQECQDYEVIVVDDGSTDGTMEMLEAQMREHAALKVIHQANAGPGAARNRGAREASGDYLAFLDSDDLWFPWALSAYVEALKAHGRVSILRGAWMEFEHAVPDLGAGRGDLSCTLHKDYFEASEHSEITLGAGLVAVRRELLLKHGFDEQMTCAEDQDLMMRLGCEPGLVEIVAPVQIAYRRHPSSATHDLQGLLAGARKLLEHEDAGRYPGGVRRRVQRWRIHGRTLRPVSIGCLKAGMPRQGWAFYRRLLPWALREWRVKYVVGFIVLAVLSGSAKT